MRSVNTTVWFDIGWNIPLKYSSIFLENQALKKHRRASDMSLLSSLLCIISVCFPTIPPATLSRYSALWCAHLPTTPFSHIHHHHHHHPFSPHSLRRGVGVRTCRLPLIWVNVIQFSGCYKPAQCPTPPPTTLPLSLTFPGHTMCRQPPRGSKGTSTHPTPPVPLNCTVFMCPNPSANG